MLNHTEINLIRRSFQRVAPQAEAVADAFYRRLFALQPALRLLFPEQMKEQKAKLMQMLGAAVGLLDKADRLIPVLEDLGRRHALYGVRDEYYDTVGAALLATLREALAEEFDEPTEKAWAEMYGFVADTMKIGALELSVAPDAAAVC